MHNQKKKEKKKKEKKKAPAAAAQRTVTTQCRYQSIVTHTGIVNDTQSERASDNRSASTQSPTRSQHTASLVSLLQPQHTAPPETRTQRLKLSLQTQHRDAHKAPGITTATKNPSR
jgi:hypothetical protein